jgi:hypothetical protein
MSLINWQVKPEYVAEKKAEIEFMLARKQEISISLSKDLAELVKMGIDVHCNAKLTITSKSREVNMKGEEFGYKNHNGDEAIEYNEVTNDIPAINKEYSITVDQVSGKVHIANDLAGSEVILQGIISGYIAKEKDKPAPPGAHFDNTLPQKEGELKCALFSGHIYFENLPVDLMGDAVTAEQATGTENQIEMELSKDEKKELVKEKAKARRAEKAAEKKANKAEEERLLKQIGDDDEKKQAGPKEEVRLELPPGDSLRTLTKGQLKPPRGSSRTQRNAWWSELRELYPQCFDTGGNWIGWSDADSNNTDSSVMAVNKPPVQATKKVPKVPKVVVDKVPGLLKSVGDGNRMTNMADKSIRQGLILGALITGKGYSTLSTPTEVGDESGSALIIVNKPRTGKFMLAGLARNASFSKKVQGYDLVDVMVFHTKYFTEDSLVYYVTNAASALQELGTQDKDIVDIKENSA